MNWLANVVVLMAIIGARVTSRSTGHTVTLSVCRFVAAYLGKKSLRLDDVGDGTRFSTVVAGLLNVSF